MFEPLEDQTNESNRTFAAKASLLARKKVSSTTQGGANFSIVAHSAVLSLALIPLTTKRRRLAWDAKRSLPAPPPQPDLNTWIIHRNNQGCPRYDVAARSPLPTERAKAFFARDVSRRARYTVSAKPSAAATYSLTRAP
jgi:hypothetical protein